MGVACVNVDLDSIRHYCRIHGLASDALPEAARAAVYRVALERFLELFAAAKVKATFFAIGEELAEAGSAAMLRAAAEAGHEIGNHSFEHDYALSRQPFETIVADLARCDNAIRDATGIAPRGFRAPGYAIGRKLLLAVAEQGYAYDSSVFPAAPYYLAKAAVMGGLKVLKRPSKAILDNPRVLLAPRKPYRPDPEQPYRKGAAPIVELPISVEPLTRVPFIGTTATLLPRPVVDGLYASLRRGSYLNFELHGIDLLDAADVGVPGLERVQPDLRVSRQEKRKRIAGLLARIADDFEVRTLEQVAGEMHPA